MRPLIICRGESFNIHFDTIRTLSLFNPLSKKRYFNGRGINFHYFCNELNAF